jgi:hypothetical protein
MVRAGAGARALRRDRDRQGQPGRAIAFAAKRSSELAAGDECIRGNAITGVAARGYSFLADAIVRSKAAETQKRSQAG